METKELLELIERIDNSGLSRFRLRDGEFEVEMERTDGELQASAVPPGETASSARRGEAGSGSEEAAGTAGQSPPPEEGEQRETVTSPIVGSFYRAPSPDAPPYVQPGDEVSKGQTLCIIEAMKVMNELEAEFDCRIIEVLAENQQMVEYGTPLFAVERLE